MARVGPQRHRGGEKKDLRPGKSMACIGPSQILRCRVPVEKEGPQKQRTLKFVTFRTVFCYSDASKLCESLLRDLGVAK